MAPIEDKDGIRISNATFSEGLELVRKADVENLIAGWMADDGMRCRPSTRGYAQFTMTAVLIAMWGLTCAPSPRTKTALLRTIYAFTDEQARAVGMTITEADRARLFSTELTRFDKWLGIRLQLFDPSGHLPARRVTVAERNRQIADLDPATRQRVAVVEERAFTLANRLVRASVHPETLAMLTGDLLVDGTKFPTSKLARGMGAKEEKRRSAAPGSDFYYRAWGDNTETGDPGTAGGVREMGYAIEATSVTASGPPTAFNSVPAVTLGIAIHSPSSGDAAAAARLVTDLVESDLMPPRSPRARRPVFVTDMGYMGSYDLEDTLLRLGYDHLRAYRRDANKKGPVHGTTLFRSQWPDGSPNARREGPEPGPIQDNGAFYCPAAADLLGEHITKKRSDLDQLGKSALVAHDRRLRERLPFVMGTLSRPYQSDTKRAARRPGEEPDLRWKLDMQCPAVQGRVRCPLVHGDHGGPAEVPIARPDWTADHYRCCHSQVTVTLTDRQVTYHQGGLIPGSWEHAIALEGMRSKTERTFSVVKNPDLTGLAALNKGPRSEAFMILQIAMAFALRNLGVQKREQIDRTRTIEKDLAALDRRLGYPVTRQPTRT